MSADGQRMSELSHHSMQMALSARLKGSRYLARGTDFTRCIKMMEAGLLLRNAISMG